MKRFLFIAFAIAGFSATVQADPLPADSLLEDFLYTLQDSMNNGHGDFLEAALDLESMIEKAVGGMSLPQEFLEGFRNELDKSFRIGREIAQKVQNEEGHYLLMSHSAEADTAYALYRFVGGGLNYHQFDIVYRDGMFRIVDIYVYLTGEFISETFRYLIEPMLLQDESLLGRLVDAASSSFGAKKRYLEDIGKLKDIRLAIQQGRHQQALGTYEALAEEVRLIKSAQIMNLMNVSNISEEMVVKYSDIYRDAFPDDPSLDLILLDYDLYREAYDDLLMRLDVLNAQVGEDAYLAYLRATVYSFMEDDSNFVVSIENAIAIEPWLADPYYTLLDYRLDKMEYGQVVDLMQKIEENLGVVFPEESMKENELFTGFLASPEYEKMKAQKAEKP